MCTSGINNKKILKINKNNPIITIQNTITAKKNIVLKVFSI